MTYSMTKILQIKYLYCSNKFMNGITQKGTQTDTDTHKASFQVLERKNLDLFEWKLLTLFSEFSLSMILLDKTTL